MTLQSIQNEIRTLRKKINHLHYKCDLFSTEQDRQHYFVEISSLHQKIDALRYDYKTKQTLEKIYKQLSIDWY